MGFPRRLVQARYPVSARRKFSIFTSPPSSPHLRLSAYVAQRSPFRDRKKDLGLRYSLANRHSDQVDAAFTEVPLRYEGSPEHLRDRPCLAPAGPGPSAPGWGSTATCPSRSRCVVAAAEDSCGGGQVERQAVPRECRPARDAQSTETECPGHHGGGCAAARRAGAAGVLRPIVPPHKDTPR